MSGLKAGVWDSIAKTLLLVKPPTYPGTFVVDSTTGKANLDAQINRPANKCQIWSGLGAVRLGLEDRAWSYRQVREDLEDR